MIDHEQKLIQSLCYLQSSQFLLIFFNRVSRLPLPTLRCLRVIKLPKVDHIVETGDYVSLLGPQRCEHQSLNCSRFVEASPPLTLPCGLLIIACLQLHRQQYCKISGVQAISNLVALAIKPDILGGRLTPAV